VAQILKAWQQKPDAVAYATLEVTFVKCALGIEWLPHPPYRSDRASNSSAIAWKTPEGEIIRRYVANPTANATGELAPIAAPHFDYEAWRRTHTEVAPHPDLMTLWRWMTTDELAELLRREPINQPEPKRSRLSDSDISSLAAKGTVKCHIDGPAHMKIWAFKVPKDEKGTRLVLDGRFFNKALRALQERGALRLPAMPPLRIRDTVDALLQPGRKVIATVDARSMFYQFAISDELGAFFGLSGHDGVRFAALPMGITFAPAWAQHLSNHLLEVLRKRLESEIPQLSWTAVAWVDNFIFTATDVGTMDRIRAKFLVLAEEVNLVMKGWEQDAETPFRMSVLGITLDVRTRTAQPTPEARQTMQEFRRLVATGPVDTQAWTLLSYFGHAAYVAYAILRYPLCLVPGLMDLHRQLARRQWYERQKVHIDAACCAETRAWLDTLLRQRYSARAPDRAAEAQWATDASGRGLGIVVASHTGVAQRACGSRTRRRPHLRGRDAGRIGGRARVRFTLRGVDCRQHIRSFRDDPWTFGECRAGRVAASLDQHSPFADSSPNRQERRPDRGRP
jgi:hypothetical protein